MATKSTKITSVRKLATHVGRSPKTVAKWVKDSRWPFSRRQPWDVSETEGMKAWAARTLQPNFAEVQPEDSLEIPAPDDTDEMRAAKLDVLRERARKLRNENNATEGNVVPLEELKQWLNEHVRAARDKFMGMGARLAPLLQGHDVMEMDMMIEERVREILTDLSNAIRNESESW